MIAIFGLINCDCCLRWLLFLDVKVLVSTNLDNKEGDSNMKVVYDGDIDMKVDNEKPVVFFCNKMNLPDTSENEPLDKWISLSNQK